MHHGNLGRQDIERLKEFEQMIPKCYRRLIVPFHVEGDDHPRFRITDEHEARQEGAVQ